MIPVFFKGHSGYQMMALTALQFSYMKVYIVLNPHKKEKFRNNLANEGLLLILFIIMMGLSNAVSDVEVKYKFGNIMFYAIVGLLFFNLSLIIYKMYLSYQEKVKLDRTLAYYERMETIKEYDGMTLSAKVNAVKLRMDNKNIIV
jgi:hypothetical protein